VALSQPPVTVFVVLPFFSEDAYDFTASFGVGVVISVWFKFFVL
jgi:hypothetical protein